MKKVLCSGLIIGVVSLFAFTSFAAEYKCGEAADHIGEKATVCGKIVETMAYSGSTILGMGAGIMDPGCVGIEVPDSMKESMPEGMYEGKEICVEGEIYKNPNGGGSIKVTDLAQIKAE